MSSKRKIIYEWKEPEQLINYRISEQKKLAKKFVLRVQFFIIPVLIFLYAFFKTFSPDRLDVNWENIFLAMFFGSLILSCIPFLLPLETRYSKRSLAISNKGISRDNFSMYWKRIKGYWVSQDEHIIELKVVKIIYSNRIFTFVLPEDVTAQNIIIETLEQNTPYVDLPDRPEIIKLSKRQVLYFSILTFIYSLLVTFLIVKTRNIVFFIVALWLSVFLGPGTIGCLHVFGKKYWKNHSIKKSAGMFNITPIFIIILLIILFEFYRLSKQAQP